LDYIEFYNICILILVPYAHPYIMRSISMTTTVLTIAITIIMMTRSIIYDSRRINTEIKRRPYPRTVIERFIHNGLICNCVYVKRWMRTESDCPHKIGGHFKWSLAVATSVEEREIVPQYRQGWSATT